MAHVLLRTSTHGAAIGADSVVYLSTVENLLAGHGLQDFRGYAPPQYPFAFPLLLAAVSGLAGIEPSEAARLVNAAAFGGIILLAGLWLRRATFSRVLAAGATLVVATSHHLSHSASYVMTESLFIVLVLLALMCMAGFAHRRVSTPVLALAALFSGLAAATRYAGVAVILTGVILLLARRQVHRHRRLGQAGVYGALAALPLGAMLTRNWLMFGVLERPRSAPGVGQPAFDGLRDVALVVTRTVVPEQMPGAVALLAWLAVAVLALAAAVGAARAVSGWWTGQDTHTGAALPAIVFSFTYLLFMVFAVPWFSASTIADDPRYLLPLYVPLLFVATRALDGVARLETAGWRTFAKWMVATLVVVGCLVNVALTVPTSAARTVTGLKTGYFHRSYNTDYWGRSETIRHLREHPVAGQVLANRFGLLHATLALEHGTAERGKYMALPLKKAALGQRLAVLPDDSLVVWLADGEQTYDYDLQHLRSLNSLSPVTELADGTVFRMVRPPAHEPIESPS